LILFRFCLLRWSSTDDRYDKCVMMPLPYHWIHCTSSCRLRWVKFWFYYYAVPAGSWFCLRRRWLLCDVGSSSTGSSLYRLRVRSLGSRSLLHPYLVRHSPFYVLHLRSFTGSFWLHRLPLVTLPRWFAALLVKPTVLAVLVRSCVPAPRLVGCPGYCTFCRWFRFRSVHRLPGFHATLLFYACHHVLHHY
jgi:hypothetical protein